MPRPAAVLDRPTPARPSAWTAPRTRSPVGPGIPGTAAQWQSPAGGRPLTCCAGACTRSSCSAPTSSIACRASAPSLRRRRARQATCRCTGWQERRPRPAGAGDGMSHQPNRTSHIYGQYARHVVGAFDVGTSRTVVSRARRPPGPSQPSAEGSSARARVPERRWASAPESTMVPLEVRRSTMAARGRGSVKVVVQPPERLLGDARLRREGEICRQDSMSESPRRRGVRPGWSGLPGAWSGSVRPARQR